MIEHAPTVKLHAAAAIQLPLIRVDSSATADVRDVTDFRGCLFISAARRAREREREREPVFAGASDRAKFIGRLVY